MSNAETIANVASKKARTALDRLEFIEGKLVPSLAEQVNGVIRNLQQQIVAMTDYLDALTESVGAEAVNEMVTNKRKERTLKEVEAKKTELAGLVQKGTLVEAEVVAAQSIISGRVLDAAGTELFPGYEVVAVAAQPEDIKAVVTGAAKNAQIKLPNGNIFELQAIYDAAPTTSA